MLFLHSLEKFFYCVIVWHGSINILGNAKLKNNIVGFNDVVRFPPLCKSLEFGKLCVQWDWVPRFVSWVCCNQLYDLGRSF